jgi:undecaprenyl diphosphate synthase
MSQLIAEKVKNNELKPEEINEDTINSLLCTTGMPDPELLIRTSGEHRISNFLLWQIAYSELYFTETFWPDFRREHLYQAIVDFQQRERRFGMTSEQVI